MMVYSYTISELSALGITEISINYRSLEADTVNMRCLKPKATESPVPWTDGDRIIISDDRSEGSPRLFNGRVRGITTSISGSEYALEIELANAVDVLNTTIYAAGDDYGQSFYTSRAVGESSNGERITSSTTVCKHCFDYALKSAMDCSRDIKFEASIMGVAGTGSQSCWSLIQAALRWVPDACTAMRYSADGDVLQFLTSRGMAPSTIDLSSHCVTGENGQTIATFEGITSIRLRPRPDLVPPVCALTGRIFQVLPDGAAINTPGAFIYHVRGSSASATVEGIKKEAAVAVKKQLPWQTVEGRRANFLPSTAMGSTVAMKKKDSNPAAKTLKWWQGFGAFSFLKELGAGAVYFGQPYFEPVSVSDAFTNDSDSEEEVSIPANYETPEGWSALYLLTSGTFPASEEDEKNLSGLKWCKGRLTQYIWAVQKPASISQERFFDFFDGWHRFVTADGDNKLCRYTKLTIEGVWINRRRVRYREGTNEEGTEDSADSDSGNSSSNVSVQGTDPDYSSALRSYYAATRKLYYDGTITLSGVRGNLGALLSTSINVVGLLPEWGNMATPCDAIEYDPISRRATLSVGSRDILSMDEILERQNLGRQQAESRNNGATYNPQDATPDVQSSSGSNNSSGSSEEESVELISPNITATHAAGKSASGLQPWQIYHDGTNWMLNGGTTPEGIEVDPININAYYEAGRRFFVRANSSGTGVIIRYRD